MRVRVSVRVRVRVRIRVRVRVWARARVRVASGHVVVEREVQVAGHGRLASRGALFGGLAVAECHVGEGGLA